MPSQVRPISELGRRYPEHGRIRLGVKTERAMKAITTFRFTSPDEVAIREIAAIYGGEARPWLEERANPPQQWQVITPVSEIRVFLPPESLSIWYELWAGGGVQRRCDGITAAVPQGTEYAEVPCLCARGEMKCRPHTRLNVVLPEIRFGGVWRLETKSRNAAEELPAMEALLSQLQAHGILEARLRIEQKSRIEGGKKKNYIVPKLLLGTSAQAALEGQGSVGALSAPKALNGGGTTTPEISSTTESEPDDQVIDAEIVEEFVEIGGSRLQIALVLAAKAAAEKVGADETEMRHAACRVASQGRTASSKRLSEQEARKALDIVNDVTSGRRTYERLPDGKARFKGVT